MAERYQRRERVDSSRLVRLGVIALIPVSVALAILAMAKGDTPLTIAMALLVLTNVAHLAFNPAMRPKNVARSLHTLAVKSKSYDFEKFRPTSLLSCRHGFA
jgi:hypothetical protein